jgi:hypothetical protein
MGVWFQAKNITEAREERTGKTGCCASSSLSLLTSHSSALFFCLQWFLGWLAEFEGVAFPKDTQLRCLGYRDREQKPRLTPALPNMNIIQCLPSARSPDLNLHLNLNPNLHYAPNGTLGHLGTPHSDGRSQKISITRFGRVQSPINPPATSNQKEQACGRVGG